MELRPAAVRDLMEALELLPGIGPRTAARLVHQLLRRRPDAERLAAALLAAAEGVHYCPSCFLLTDIDPCVVCSDPSRDHSVMCVLEDPLNAWSVEATGEFHGLYHVLLGVLDPLHGIGPEELTVDALLGRTRGGEVREVILATNPTVEGEATAHFLAELLRPTGVMLTRIAFGLPAGGEISYADHVTLTRALSGRRGMD